VVTETAAMPPLKAMSRSLWGSGPAPPTLTSRTQRSRRLRTQHDQPFEKAEARSA
jgi:hypothetical protein